MRAIVRLTRLLLIVLALALPVSSVSGCSRPVVAAAAGDPLPSWKDRAAKRSIVAFVHNVTRAGSPDFVPASERIATFDNDGTL